MKYVPHIELIHIYLWSNISRN